MLSKYLTTEILSRDKFDSIRIFLLKFLFFVKIILKINFYYYFIVL